MADHGAQSSRYVIPVGGAVEIAGPADFVRCLESNGAFYLEINGGADIPFGAGLSYQAPMVSGIKRIRLINKSADPVTCVMAWGWGTVVDDRLVLTENSLRIVMAGSGFTDNPAITVGTTPVLILPAGSRTRARIRAGAADLWIGPTNAVAATGWPTMLAGETFDVHHQADVWAVRASAVLPVAVYKETDLA